jgi:hypothetical protein
MRSLDASFTRKEQGTSMPLLAGFPSSSEQNQLLDAESGSDA